MSQEATNIQTKSKGLETSLKPQENVTVTATEHANKQQRASLQPQQEDTATEIKQTETEGTPPPTKRKRPRTIEDEPTTSSSTSQEHPSISGVSTKVIILVRHGEYEHDKEHKALTEKGKTQAAQAAKALADMQNRGDLNIKQIISSTMVRARETFEAIFKEFPTTPFSLDYDLEEGNPMLPNTIARFNRVYSKYFVPTQGKSIETTLLVCHGNVIRYLVCKALQVRQMSWRRLHIANCSFTSITVPADGKTPWANYIGSCTHVPNVDQHIF